VPIGRLDFSRTDVKGCWGSLQTNVKGHQVLISISILTSPDTTSGFGQT